SVPPLDVIQLAMDLDRGGGLHQGEPPAIEAYQAPGRKGAPGRATDSNPSANGPGVRLRGPLAADDERRLTLSRRQVHGQPAASLKHPLATKAPDGRVKRNTRDEFLARHDVVNQLPGDADNRFDFTLLDSRLLLPPWHSPPCRRGRSGRSPPDGG